MHLIRKAAPALAVLGLAAAAAAAATSFSVQSSISSGQTLSGKLRWTATVSGISTGDVSTVEFFVDGALRTTEKAAPYVYGGDRGLLDTTALSNGAHVFAVTATAVDGSKAGTTATATTKNPPANTSKPSLSGTARDGSTLTANRGTWSGPATIVFAYAWLRCDTSGNNCAIISGATSSTYTATAADVGHRLRVVVTASNSAGAVNATSDASGTVAARGNAPTSTSPPGISGTARDGSLLAASNGGWANNPTSYSYQWLRCDANGANCAAIAGANAKQYTLTTADVDRRLRVLVTASNGFGSGSAASNPTSAVQATGSAPASTSLPSISGSTRVGSTLSASTGGWSGTQPIRIGFQWRRCDAAGNSCVDIQGASSSAYTQVNADLAHTVRVNVTATNARGSTLAVSRQTDLIAPARPTSHVLDVTQVSLPNELVLDGVSFTPRLVRSRLAPIVARFHVSDTHGMSIAGALVLAIGLPYSWVQSAPEAMTDGAGWATVVLHPGASLPRRGAIVFFARARKPGENVLGGVTARRLVQVGIRR